MKVTRKLGKPSSLIDIKDLGQDHEIAPSLDMHDLPGEIEGMPEKGNFEAQIKGKVKRHSSVTEGGKTKHHYDCDVHHFECKNKKVPKQKKSTREQVDEAFEKTIPRMRKDDHAANNAAYFLCHRLGILWPQSLE